MKNIFFVMIFSFLLFGPVFQAAAQNNTEASSTTLDTTGFPQWVRDLRRWDIIAFGAFPFAMFTVTFFHDLYRWNNANGMAFNDEGFRYAPWPLKSAGFVEMTKEEYERTIWMAVSLSATIAIVDFVIVKIKHNRERRRIESIPSGSVNINKRPYPIQEEEDEAAGTDIEDESGFE